MIFRLSIQIGEVPEGRAITSVDGNTVYVVLGPVFKRGAGLEVSELTVGGERMFAVHDKTNGEYRLLTETTDVVVNLYRHEVQPLLAEIDPTST